MILGLDISTSITGYTVLDYEGNILACSHIDLRKEKDFFKKIQIVNTQLEVINDEYEIEQVYIEQSLQSFRSGFSSAQTLSLLSKINGIVATNTSIDKSILPNTKDYEEGGISGKSLHKKSTDIIKYISKKTKYKLTIIGVGGIYDHKTMIDKFNAGASLVQIYTGWIYEGPGLIKKMNKIMVNELSKN